MSLIVTIDGASGSGKTALSKAVAGKLNATLLPSGLLYRLVALWHTQGMMVEAMPFFQIHNNLKIDVVADHMVVYWGLNNISAAIMDQSNALKASTMAKEGRVRAFLLDVQRSWPYENGLIAEGRDMGSIVFPNASVKFFITCAIHTRAKRRVQQLLGLGIHVKFEDVVREIAERDLQDQSREIAPLDRPDGAICMENDGDFDYMVEKIVRIALLHKGVMTSGS